MISRDGWQKMRRTSLAKAIPKLQQQSPAIMELPAGNYPLVTFGIPGDSVTAVLLGSLLIHGLRPGKSLFEQQSSLVNLIFAGMLISNILMLFGGIFLSRFYAKILSLKDQYLLPIIAVLSIVEHIAFEALYLTWG